MTLYINFLQCLSHCQRDRCKSLHRLNQYKCTNVIFIPVAGTWPRTRASCSVRATTSSRRQSIIGSLCEPVVPETNCDLPSETSTDPRCHFAACRWLIRWASSLARNPGNDPGVQLEHLCNELRAKSNLTNKGGRERERERERETCGQLMFMKTSFELLFTGKTDTFTIIIGQGNLINN